MLCQSHQSTMPLISGSKTPFHKGHTVLWSPDPVKNYSSNQCFERMIRINHVKYCIRKNMLPGQILSEKNFKLVVKWHLIIWAADKMVPVLPPANHFLITECKHTHNMMKNVFTRMMNCHLLMQSSSLFVCSTHMRDLLRQDNPSISGIQVGMQG